MAHLEKLFYCSGFPNRHDHFIRMYMFKSLSGDVISATIKKQSKGINGH